MNASTRLARRHPFEKQSTFQGETPDAPELALAADNTAKKQRNGSSGTALAIIDIASSGASSSARRWGGKRNSASRASEHLSLNQASNIIAAAQYAAAIFLPLNRHLTIHWEQAGIPDERAAWATGRFLKLAGDWIAKRGGRIAWTWVRENGDGKGSHVHILMHLPVRVSLGPMQWRWLRFITGSPYRARTIRTKRIGGSARAARTTPGSYRANLAAVVAYVLKGCSPATARALGLERVVPGGQTIGKRAATSQNIGRSARQIP